MGHLLQSLGGGFGNGKHVTLDISAIFIAFIQSFLLRLCQGHGYGDTDLSTGGEGNLTTVQTLQEQVGIVRRNGLIPVQIGIIRIGDVRPYPCHIVQQSLRVVCIDAAVAVKIHVDQAVVELYGLTIDAPSHIGLQTGSVLAEQLSCFICFA